mmetsp:Transcript_91234/g.289140  ORF Transcript_91234/g.289140 Transcript_91234/m.289140 type:complete len:307 (-) Transcript_91234:3-923(-)
MARRVAHWGMSPAMPQVSQGPSSANKSMAFLTNTDASCILASITSFWERSSFNASSCSLILLPTSSRALATHFSLALALSMSLLRLTSARVPAGPGEPVSSTNFLSVACTCDSMPGTSRRSARALPNSSLSAVAPPRGVAHGSSCPTSTMVEGSAPGAVGRPMVVASSARSPDNFCSATATTVQCCRPEWEAGPFEPDLRCFEVGYGRDSEGVASGLCRLHVMTLHERLVEPHVCCLEHQHEYRQPAADLEYCHVEEGREPFQTHVSMRQNWRTGLEDVAPVAQNRPPWAHPMALASNPRSAWAGP